MKPLTVDLASPTGDAQQQQQPSPVMAARVVGRAVKKHSILSRINLAHFQSSTKIEVWDSAP